MVVNSDDPWEELRAYTATYLKEEIAAEALVRRLESFTSFLFYLAAKVGEELNYASFGSDLGLGPKTVEGYLETLEDTLIGFHVPPFQKTIIRKSISRSKFYLFDLGVTSSLLERTEIPRNSDSYGKSFEHFIILEIRAALSYFRRREQLCFWRTHSGQEVDCIIGQEMALAIKSTDLVHERHLRHLKALREEGLIKNFAVISHDLEERIIDGIHIYPWREFLKKLWGGEF
jgi:predicted AAA+ superfamily ATPase